MGFADSTPSVSLRRARPVDAMGIASLVDEAYSPYIPRIGRKPGPMLDDYAQVIEESVVYVCEDDTGITGVLVVQPEDTDLLLVNIAVANRCKGQGIGKQLMSYCEDYARALGCLGIRLYTHELMTENLAIYSKLGYRETHRATQQGFARVFMRKPLGNS
ncbi:GNAT family N-acetyltransferase [Pseudomonas sp. RC10]|uniref:GNAT family N-acetyltransferase n=1 Tax=Pseudomonas bambusae TaxID=3139142 RepID=UPI00313A438F